MKKIITIVGPNGVGKTTAANSLLKICLHSAYVDSDCLRAINPFKFTDKTKKAVTENIFCVFRNYLLCDDIETIIFSYGFHGERKEIYNETIQRLHNEDIEFDSHIVILKCEYDENIRRALNDSRDIERVKRGMSNTFNLYDDYGFPFINTTDLNPRQVAEKIKELFCI